MTELTCNVEITAVLISLGKYIQQNFAFRCRFWNDRGFTRNLAYGQRIRQIRICGRANSQHGDEGCASRNSEKPGCKRDGRDLRAGPTGERGGFLICCFPYLVLALLFYVTTEVATSCRLTHCINVVHSADLPYVGRSIGSKLLVGVVR